MDSQPLLASGRKQRGFRLSMRVIYGQSLGVFRLRTSVSGRVQPSQLSLIARGRFVDAFLTDISEGFQKSKTGLRRFSWLLFLGDWSARVGSAPEISSIGSH